MSHPALQSIIPILQIPSHAVAVSDRTTTVPHPFSHEPLVNYLLSLGQLFPSLQPGGVGHSETWTTTTQGFDRPRFSAPYNLPTSRTARALTDEGVAGYLMASEVADSEEPFASGSGSQGPISPEGLVTALPVLIASEADRDALLSYAYRIYESSLRWKSSGLSHRPLPPSSESSSAVEAVQATPLLPLLSMISGWSHDATSLLLLGCVHFALRNYDKSLSINREILLIDPHNAEAMCNLGCTLRALGRKSEAIACWWDALRLRPRYWDVVHNALSCLQPSATETESVEDADNNRQQALNFCSFVLSRIVEEEGNIKATVAPDEVDHVQRVLNTRAIVLERIGAVDINAQLRDLLTAIELPIHPPWPNVGGVRYTFHDVVMAVFLGSLIVSNAEVPDALLNALPSPGRRYTAESLREPGIDILHLVHLAGSQLYDAVTLRQDGVFPIVLLLPEEALHLPFFLFSSSSGVLPAICSNDGHAIPPSEDIRRRCHARTATVLVSLAERLQERRARSSVIFTESSGILRSSTSLVLLLYYLALGLQPSATIFNNLGIVIAEVSAIRNDVTRDGPVTGPLAARTYYERGLLLHPTHPFLLVNLGALAKDHGNHSKAQLLFGLAIHHKPEFTIALVNLANMLRDEGKSSDALQYFQRAVNADPDLPEAVSGLAISRIAVCDWQGRGRVFNNMGVDNDGHRIFPGSPAPETVAGWLPQVLELTDSQIALDYGRNIHLMRQSGNIAFWMGWVQRIQHTPFGAHKRGSWERTFQMLEDETFDRTARRVDEGGVLIRLIEWLRPRLQRKWYVDAYGKVARADQRMELITSTGGNKYDWPPLPPLFDIPLVPCIMPFNAFCLPLSARATRLVSHRHGLRTSYATLTQTWLPRHVLPPPPPPFRGKINIGYVSGDFNDHPLSHLIQSVFGLHDRAQFKVFAYAMSPSDNSSYRQKIETETDVFRDMSGWSTKEAVEKIRRDQIHILLNLGGYTRGARNDIFAARPCPVQISLMGFAGTTAAGWSDYLVCDPVACPPTTCAFDAWQKRPVDSMDDSPSDMPQDNGLDFEASLDPESASNDWVYTEKLIYMPHTFMLTDHKQSSRGDEGLSVNDRAKILPEILWESEMRRRAEQRHRLFPDLSPDTIIYANFNQAYKIDHQIFAVWMRILARVTDSILCLLRFPPDAEANLMKTARDWAGEAVASRIRFLDVTSKNEHIMRGRAVDLFLDTVECSAHTVAADVLWSGTPIITWPRYEHKMCSRVGASMAYATGLGSQMVVRSLPEYEARVVVLTTGRGRDALIDLRRKLFVNRDSIPLFDTARWTRNVEKGYKEAWRRWVLGTAFEGSLEWEASKRAGNVVGNIIIEDRDPVHLRLPLRYPLLCIARI
ncbi:glycosyltransferase family 41 protein [Auriscalpium vulgare]|uniref:Glycosyltransferase family 41 protein n=1 Tax=Auriscalpium vulgare TaxID=40419 RepID=A0ACB8RW12_9AGAM|nr:glycosyltransferase family 41 protein [Auriscalpium vulgare]